MDNSSVSIFVNKKSTSKNPNKQITIDNHAKDLEDICASVICNSVTSLNNVLTEITHWLSPIIDTGNKLQETLGSNIKKEVATSKSGLWNTMLYLYGNTEHMHTEKDCVYTIITVLTQSFLRKKQF